MTLKDLLIQELDNVSDPLIVEVLDFLRFLKAKQAQDSAVLQVDRASLSSASQPEQPPSYSLQGKQPYCYDDPFAPAIPTEDWEVLQ
ncbi:MAG: hypothetical protein HY785_11055 [Oscillatoriophycideae cyanobacterium NC_groundwater_1537_Pr4_S-0.65um_50_18]|nr:hypothetical protein [Oscillatoriophycideae cyanobacterium NC_groundwater_1537_Pr4_S-0.65um_50_18]